MLVCHCHRITDRDLREAAQRGARTHRDLDLRCPAASACGGCAPAVDAILGTSRAGASAEPGIRPVFEPVRRPGGG
jgi:bacterioferritin-associated ferredoxin